MKREFQADDALLHAGSAARPQSRSAAGGDGGRVVLNLGSAHVGVLVGVTPEGLPLVDFAGNPGMTAVLARTCVDVRPVDIGREVVLMFEAGDLARPLLMGCLRDREPSLLASSQHASDGVEADELVLSASQSLTLRCGKASVTLTRDGRVIVHGTRVESRATGTNRIQGGSVKIN